ncbi:phytoene desaturase family protein [Candidatus Hakubella thermalkaliphila]|nr:FAD-dependent oxidoreductase [Candidatus Hakubella thermalkaliphila]
MKAPAYFASGEFKKYDWRVKVDPQKPKGENEYDVIIIGSGLGGLTCGSLLSKRGYKVLVLEQHYRVGGYCSSFQRRGFVFNTSVEDVSGLWEKGPLTYLLRELGLKKEDLFVRNKTKYIFKDREIDIPNELEDFLNLLSDLFPDEKEKIHQFFAGAKKAYEECPTLIKNQDEGYHIVINSNADPSLAPEGKASVTLITFANYDDFPERETEEYLKKKKEFAEELIKKSEKVIPDLSKYIIVQDAATPKTFERYTLMPEGAIYSFDQSIGVKRPYFKTPIKGLYLAGASTFPGGGIEAVVISGMICPNDICNWEVERP